MKDNVITQLTGKDDKYACAVADKIISESKETDAWYEYFDDFASLLDYPKSLVRNRVLYILAANAQWDEEKRFDAIIADLSKYKDSMRPLLEKDIAETEKILTTAYLWGWKKGTPRICYAYGGIG